jgi:hypothetical protein
MDEKKAGVGFCCRDEYKLRYKSILKDEAVNCQNILSDFLYKI